MKRKKKTLNKLLSMSILLSLFCSPVFAKEEAYSHELHDEYEEEILRQLPQKEKEYLEYGLKARVQGDPKGSRSPFRSTFNAWSWPDGVICITTEGKGPSFFNSWHAALVAAQVPYAVIEAPKPFSTVRYRTGEWKSDYHTIWQVGVKSTSEDQDRQAAIWAEGQYGKPYNLNFFSSDQTKSFYCSQLVWAAYYYTTGVDLNKPDNDSSRGFAVHPGEFLKNSKTGLIYRNK